MDPKWGRGGTIEQEREEAGAARSTLTRCALREERARQCQVKKEKRERLTPSLGGIGGMSVGNENFLKWFG